MARVVLVHGINNTFSGPRVMASTWVPALLDGIDLAGGGKEELGADDIEEGDEADLVLKWWRAAAQVDSTVVPPDTPDARLCWASAVGSRGAGRVEVPRRGQRAGPGLLAEAGAGLLP